MGMMERYSSGEAFYPSSSTAPRRVILLIILSISLGLIQSLLAIFLPPMRLPILPWFMPAVEAFCLGGGLSLSLLFFWRFLLRKELYGLWVGVAFWLSSLINLSYLLTFQGLFPDLRSAPAYHFYLMYLVLLSPCLAFFLGAKQPPQIARPRARLFFTLAWSFFFCLVGIGGVILLDGRLPLLSIDPRASFLSGAIPYAFFFVYIGAIWLHWRRFKRGHEPLLGYVLVFYVVSLWVFPGIILSRGPYDFGWYSYHALRAIGYVLIYLALLREFSDLYRASQRREEMQKLLKEMSQDIASLDLDRLLKKLTGKIREVLGVDISDVRIIEHGEWKVLGVSGIEPEPLQSAGIPSGRGRSRWVIENRRPLAISDIQRQTGIPRGEVLSRLGIRGYLGIPLFSKGGEVMAVLRVLTYQPREFAQEEVDWLQQLANGAAIAIENATLLQALKGKTREMQAINLRLNRLVEEQSALRQKLENAFQAKSDFLNTMAHELRTPLNVIVGTQQLLNRGAYGELNEGQKKSLQRIDRNIHDILHLIDEILGLARLEAKRVRLRIEEFSLRELIEELGSSFSPLARAKGIPLVLDANQRIPPLKSDPSKVKEVLQNLLSNAVKYTDSGKIEIQVVYHSNENNPEPREERVSITVRDTGIGIRKEDIPHISEPFYLGEGMDRARYPGTGLGLSITKGIVELLKGDLKVESEWGKGSNFTVTLPIVFPF